MKKFIDPEIEILKYAIEDIITTSDMPEDGDDDMGWH